MFKKLLVLMVLFLMSIPILASGTETIIDDFLVNDDIDTASQDHPTISVDSSGNFVITWSDKRSGNGDIYAQRYNSSGTALGSNFKVNDDPDTAVQLHTAISMNNSGEFVITWNDYRNVYWDADIYAQRYNSSGIPLGSNFKVNGDSGGITQVSPVISMNDSGSFIIAWIDSRNTTWGDIYSQRYGSSGTALGSNFRVNDNANTPSHTAWMDSPTVSMDDSGDFVVTWEDDRNRRTDIYAQRYNSSGTPLGPNFMVNDQVGANGGISPAISMNNSGNFVITWYDWRNWKADVYAQRYNSSGTTIGSNFKVNSDAGAVFWRCPAVAMNGTGSFVITWMDKRNNNSDIYAQRYNSLGAALGCNFRVNSDTGTTDQWTPAVAMDGTGSFVITWCDYRNGNADIYAQRYNSSGIALGSNSEADGNSGTAPQWFPAIATNRVSNGYHY